ncbi:hypothetical protein AB0I77_46360 [Streptomyces sp. NPDC050619]|uniref:hypothetical protein n=1 Tax=Streptomyces sp. NPDC050619 TaxID=3157214 RepID=UPI0034163AA1
MIAPSRQGTAARSDVEILSLRSGQVISEENRRHLVEGLAEALPELRISRLFELRPDILTGPDYLLITFDRTTGRAVGLLTARSFTLSDGSHCLQAMVQFVGGAHRRGTVLRENWLRLLRTCVADRGFPDVIALKTYNPVAYCAMRALGRTGDIYPALTGPQDPRMTAWADEVAEGAAPSCPFEPEVGVVRGSGVPVDLYRSRPTSEDPAVNAYFAAHTDPGDRVLCLVRVDSAETGERILAGLGAERV